MSKDIKFCVMCENPDTLLEEDDFDFCKKCQIEEARKWLINYKKLSEYLVKELPESSREQIVKAAWMSIK